ncbi:aldehyde dehydrogenase (NADP(+)) [Gordonia jinhuaensis]|uniref:Aldehyde dehydrogenase n=1 Tax=Gordonia jinhuaensis TaxID=1517702 RepID=A0A916TJ61_9ACTN|nr:aldehyde dehydrogenase (NADP(+)) [Gordonia jinhuaensis]GGB47590.1 aldehyde dehydrogenase [Gordonia jinhuaensis]
MAEVVSATRLDASETSPADLDRVLAAADAAADKWAMTPHVARARSLAAVADILDEHADELIDMAARESHLPVARLTGELTRTTFQLRFLGSHVADEKHLRPAIDPADPSWPMGAPRPDLRRTHIPIGVVLNFAASNFPFAFSVAGGDTAAALAAGCPVVVKCHPGHPELSARVAELTTRALRESGAPDGVFATITGVDAGDTALRDPRVRAASFTGSVPGGRALFDIANSRPDPIPFFGELGSINPVFVTAAADTARGADIAKEFIASFTMGVGQFCTSPGLLVVPENSATLAALRDAELPAPAPMLTERIRDGYERAAAALREHRGVDPVAASAAGSGLEAASQILATTVAEALGDPDTLLDECFGPSSVVVTYRDATERDTLARTLPGQLTATVQGENSDIGPELASLTATLARHAGRVLWNQWPTGVSVTDAQNHGGPYPASTSVHWTSVGTAAIDRFLRPIAYQNFPAELLPAELRAGTPGNLDTPHNPDSLDNVAPGA